MKDSTSGQDRWKGNVALATDLGKNATRNERTIGGSEKKVLRVEGTNELENKSNTWPPPVNRAFLGDNGVSEAKEGERRGGVSVPRCRRTSCDPTGDSNLTGAKRFDRTKLDPTHSVVLHLLLPLFLSLCHVYHL